MFSPINWSQSYKIMVESIPSAGSAVASAASHAAPQVASAAATFPHPLPGGAIYPPHPTYPTYASFHRYGRRGGRGFLPMLLIVGSGAWAYSHLKHQLGDIKEEQEYLHRRVNSIASSTSGNVGNVAGGSAMGMGMEEEKPKERRSRWERKWGHHGRWQEQQSQLPQQQQMFVPPQQHQQQSMYQQGKMV